MVFAEYIERVPNKLHPFDTQVPVPKDALNHIPQPLEQLISHLMNHQNYGQPYSKKAFFQDMQDTFGLRLHGFEDLNFVPPLKMRIKNGDDQSSSITDIHFLQGENPYTQKRVFLFGVEIMQEDKHWIAFTTGEIQNNEATNLRSRTTCFEGTYVPPGNTDYGMQIHHDVQGLRSFQFRAQDVTSALVGLYGKLVTNDTDVLGEFVSLLRGITLPEDSHFGYLQRHPNRERRYLALAS